MQHSLPQNYKKMLYLCAKNPWIVYDNIQKRAWLMFAVNLVHRMMIDSQANLGLSLPLCTAKPSKESLHILLENADYMISQCGEHKYLLHHLVVECIAKQDQPNSYTSQDHWVRLYGGPHQYRNKTP